MKKIKFGIVGSGLWGQTHAEAYNAHPMAELTAVCDVIEEKAKSFADAFGVEKVYNSAADLVRNADIDAVAIVTPDFAHCGPIVQAAEAGKHIIVEKPLATNRKDIRTIVKAVGDAGIKFMVDFHTRWSPPIFLARKDIREGKLGRVLSAYFRLNDTVMVPTEMLSWAAKSSVLWFLGSHTVDTLRFLLQDEVKRVYCVSRSGHLKGMGVDVADLYQSILEFESGAVATIENSWIIPNSCPKVNDIKVNITGTKGMFNMDLTNNQAVERYLESSSDHPDFLVKTRIQEKPVGFAYESIRSFVDALANDKPVLSNLEDGIKVSQVIFALFESAESGRPVDVDYKV
jgi:predicted dehydrogenase